MDDSLFNLSLKLNEDVKRNICYSAKPSDAFSSIMDEGDDVEIGNQIINYARTQLPNAQNDFYYTTAIEYPFVTEPFMSSRYTDGLYPVWYGAREIETTIYETVFNAIKYITATEGALSEPSISIERTIFDVHCDAILINLVGRENEYPQLISDDYTLTHQIGHEVGKGGYPGLLSPSARWKGGENVNIFKQDVLSNPRLIKNVTYKISPMANKVDVFGLSNNMTISFS